MISGAEDGEATAVAVGRCRADHKIYCRYLHSFLADRENETGGYSRCASASIKHRSQTRSKLILMCTDSRSTGQAVLCMFIPLKKLIHGHRTPIIDTPSLSDYGQAKKRRIMMSPQNDNGVESSNLQVGAWKSNTEVQCQSSPTASRPWRGLHSLFHTCLSRSDE